MIWISLRQRNKSSLKAASNIFLVVVGTALKIPSYPLIIRLIFLVKVDFF